MSTDKIAHAKAELRAQMRTLLASLGAQDQACWSQSICRTLTDFPALMNAQSVMLFAPMPGEPDLTAFARELALRGTVLSIPEVDWERTRLIPRQVASLEGLRAGPRGVCEIPENAPALPPESLGAVLVPGLAFSTWCNRLGRGKGFYDRFLGSLPRDVLSVGVCFDRQLLRDIPYEEHDLTLSAVVTPTQCMVPP